MNGSQSSIFDRTLCMFAGGEHFPKLVFHHTEEHRDLTNNFDFKLKFYEIDK